MLTTLALIALALLIVGLMMAAAGWMWSRESGFFGLFYGWQLISTLGEFLGAVLAAIGESISNS